MKIMKKSGDYEEVNTETLESWSERLLEELKVYELKDV